MLDYARRVVRGYFIFLTWVAATFGLVVQTILWIISVGLVLAFTFGAIIVPFSCIILGHLLRAAFVLVEDGVLAIVFFATANILNPLSKSKPQWVKPKS